METYVVRDNDLILDDQDKHYVLKIRDLPSEEKPREKMLKYGPVVLSVQELLAIVLNVGTKKEGVLEMTSRVIKEYGEKSLASQTNPESMAKDLDIPIVKATQIVACAELGRRFFQKNGAGATVIRTAKDVFSHVKDMRELPKEHLRGIYLNAHHRIIHDEVISIGTVNSNIIHPREVFKPALEYSAVAVVLVHNHPSGITKPSDADKEVTKQLVEAGNILGINLLDHVIVTKNKFRSIAIDYS
ncbi:MAG: DNA repair protein RadC [Patescibacteria group bacterium]|nr:MAG: DNA repair protein RadC [Patescibacteria group bacterium]